jgi:glycosyltransferase involved in cell wall biosynthesis
LQVIPSFPSSAIADQLAGVCLGVFPSYLEGFGIAVIEQLAAGIPVLAYAAPGPTDILPADWLCPCGDRQTLLVKLTALLESNDALAVARQRALHLAEPYRWRLIAARWDRHYRCLLAQRRG